MKYILPIICIICITSCFNINQEGNRHNGATDNKINENSVLLSIRIENKSYKLNESINVFFHIINKTDKDSIVPFFYDAIYFIDNNAYTNFPKPRLVNSSGGLILGEVLKPSAEKANTEIINKKGFEVWDPAINSCKPSKILVGKHVMWVKLGELQSNKVGFEVIE